MDGALFTMERPRFITSVVSRVVRDVALRISGEIDYGVCDRIGATKSDDDPLW